MHWQEDYRRKCVSAAEAVRLIKSGDQLFTSGNVATPRLVLRALIARAHELARVQLILDNAATDKAEAEIKSS